MFLHVNCTLRKKMGQKSQNSRKNKAKKTNDPSVRSDRGRKPPRTGLGLTQEFPS